MCAAIFSISVVELTAATRTWTANTDKFWGKKENWESSIRPEAADEAYFDINGNSFLVDMGGANRAADSVTLNSTTAYTFEDEEGSETLTTGGFSVLAGSGHSVDMPVVFEGDFSASIASGSDLTVSGALSGAGSLTKSGSGTLLLSGANTYSGGTIITAGTLQLGVGATTGSILGDVANAGVLDFKHSSNISFAGLISGVGSLRQSGTGSLTLNAANTHSGATHVAAGSLVLGDALALQNSAVTVDAGAVLDLNGQAVSLVNLSGAGELSLPHGSTVTFGDNDAAVSFAGSITGLGALKKNGSGALTLTGTNSYVGATTINGGLLELDNLSGSLTNKAGTFSPGESGAGIAVIAGAFDQRSAGRLVCEIGGSTAGSGYDQLQAGSLVVLNGTIEVTYINDYSPVDGDRFTLITGTNLLDSGVNYVVPSLAANLHWELEWTNSSLTLNVVGDSLASFRDTYGLAVDGSADAQDWSGNGVANILYYALGLGDPNAVDVDHTKLPTLSVEADGTVVYAYDRLVDSSELDYTAYSSINLSNWFDLDGSEPQLTLDSESITAVDTDYERRTLEYTTDEPKVFFRLQVVDPNAPFFYATQNHQPSLALQYYISTQGEAPTNGGDLSPAALSEVKLFAVGQQPAGYLPAEGQLLPIASYTQLYSFIGTTFGGDGRTTFGLPDLRGRAIIGDGQGPGLTNRSLGQSDGVDEVALTTDQLPSHAHSTTAGDTGLAGNAASHTNMQPYVALNPIIRVTGGLVPSDGLLLSGSESDGYLGEIKWLATSHVPSGWLKANGQLLTVNGHSSLYSLIGLTYGGDGITTFALPDLRGRAVMAAGTGPGLSTRTPGDSVGQESNTLSVDQMPAHTHTLASGEETGATGLGQTFTNMMPSLTLNYMQCTATNEVRINAIPDFIIGLAVDGAIDRPDLRGRIPISVSPTYAYGSVLGSEISALSADDLPAHTHADPE